MKIDLNKNAEDNVTTLINEKNNTNWQPGQLGYGDPVDYSDTSGRNTQLLVYKTGGMPRSMNVFYKRVGLLHNVANPIVTYEITDSTTSAELLAAVAQGLGVRADEIEFDIPFDPSLTAILVRPKLNSLLYIQPTGIVLHKQGAQPGGKYVAVRPGWFVQLAGNEVAYYPTSVNGQTFPTPTPGNWTAFQGSISIGGVQGALMDITVYDSDLSGPATEQPTWTATNAVVNALGLFQSAGYQSIYDDPAATLIVSKLSSVTPTVVSVLGTYTDGSTITAEVILPPSIDLGPPLNLAAVPVDGWGLGSMAARYINKDGRVFTVDLSKYPQSGYKPGTYLNALPVSLLKTTVDTLAPSLLGWTKGSSAFVLGDNQTIAEIPIQPGSFIVGTDSHNASHAFLQPDGTIAVDGTPTGGGIAHLPEGLTGVTSLAIDPNDQSSGNYTFAVQEGVKYNVAGLFWNNDTFQTEWRTKEFDDDKNFVIGLGSWLLDKTGEVWGPTLATDINTWGQNLAVYKRLSSVSLLGEYGTALGGVSSDGNIWDVPTNTALTTEGGYRWAGGGFVVNEKGQATMRVATQLITIKSALKAPPGDTFSYQYEENVSGYLQYTGTTIPKQFRRVFGGAVTVRSIAPEGYGRTIMSGYFNKEAGVWPVLEYCDYGLGYLDDFGWALNLDGKVNFLESQIANREVDPDQSQPEFTNSFVAMACTPNGQTPGNPLGGNVYPVGSLMPSSNAFPALGQLADGTVVPVGYSQVGASLAAIYTAKKVRHMQAVPSQTISAGVGSLVTVDGDILVWGLANFGNMVSSGTGLMLDDTQYLATNPAIVKVKNGNVAAFGLEADGTVHTFDYPWPTVFTGGFKTLTPTLNCTSTLPAGVKAWDVFCFGSIVFIIALDRQTVYAADLTLSWDHQPVVWKQYTLQQKAVALSFATIQASNNPGASFQYVTDAGDIVSVLFTQTSTTDTLSEFPVASDVVNVGLLN